MLSRQSQGDLMMVKVKALKQFVSTTYGNIEPDMEFPCSSAYAYQWKESGMVEIIQTKESEPVVIPQAGDVPLVSGPDKESGLSQVAPASPKKTRKKSSTKKRSQ